MLHSIAGAWLPLVCRAGPRGSWKDCLKRGGISRVLQAAICTTSERDRYCATAARLHHFTSPCASRRHLRRSGDGRKPVPHTATVGSGSNTHGSQELRPRSHGDVAGPLAPESGQSVIGFGDASGEEKRMQKGTFPRADLARTSVKKD